MRNKPGGMNQGESTMGYRRLLAAVVLESMEFYCRQRDAGWVDEGNVCDWRVRWRMAPNKVVERVREVRETQAFIFGKGLQALLDFGGLNIHPNVIRKHCEPNHWERLMEDNL